MAKKKGATGRILHDPIKDKLVPIYPLDLSRIRTIDELVRAMGQTAFTARQIGDAADVLEAMARDKDCFGVMTLSGAMTVAKMALVFCDLVEAGIINAIVSTGALMAHGLVEAEGLHHYRYDEKMNDRELFAAGYNRVYDSLEPETNLDHVEETMQHILENWDADDVLCSWKINRKIGEYLSKHTKGRGILKTCYEHKVPVFVPAFTDSELGIDVALHQRLRKKAGQKLLRFDPYEDFEFYASTMLATKRMGIFTIGGGVPRNWAQQFGVYAELLGAARLREASAEALQLWRANLSRTGELGRSVGKHVHRGSIVGKICASGGRRTIRRSARRCHGGAAVGCRSGAGTHRISEEALISAR